MRSGRRFGPHGWPRPGPSYCSPSGPPPPLRDTVCFSLVTPRFPAPIPYMIRAILATRPLCRPPKKPGQNPRQLRVCGNHDQSIREHYKGKILEREERLHGVQESCPIRAEGARRAGGARSARPRAPPLGRSAPGRLGPPGPVGPRTPERGHHAILAAGGIGGYQPEGERAPTPP